jgi:putative FmdB family regulatory protein
VSSSSKNYYKGAIKLIYVYRCRECEKEIEVKAKVSDPAPACEECDKPMVRKIVATNFILVGKGWAKDGYN